jgi:CheY-like chemotaxis protein
LPPAAIIRQPEHVPLRVLIVDDDPSFRATARSLLRARGLAVAGEASDYKEALAAVRELAGCSCKRHVLAHGRLPARCQRFRSSGASPVSVRIP